MAVIYYPKNQLMYIRDTVTSSSNYESVYLNTQPNTIIYFDTSSMMQGINASLIPITASWATDGFHNSDFRKFELLSVC